MKKVLSFIMALAIVATMIPSSFARENSDLDAKIITVADTSSYLVLDLASIKSKAKKIFLDGKLSAFTSVDNSGKIIKREFDGKHSSLKVEFEDGSSITRDIGNIYKKFPYQTSSNKRVSPDVVIGHASMAVWDFHNAKKDANGVEIMYPSSSTFDADLSKKNDVDVETSPTPDSSKDSVKSIKYGEDIVFEYDLSNQKERNNYKNIISVKRLDNKKSAIKLDYSKKIIKKEGQANSGKGVLIIKFDKNKSIQKMGEHKIEMDLKGLNKSLISKINYVKDMDTSTLDPINPSEEKKDNEYEYGEDIVIKYNLNNEKEKDEFMRLSSIVKVYEDTLQEVDLSISKNSENNIGKVKISFAKSNILHKNGSHKIKLIFRGLAPKEKTIKYKKPAPEVILTADNGEYVTGKSTLFNLKGFDYTFQQSTGIKAVYLNGQELKRNRVINDGEDYEYAKSKDPNVLENESGNPWHVVGESFRIKNDGVKYLKRGVNNLTIKYEGYHDSNFKFTLNEGRKNIKSANNTEIYKELESEKVDSKKEKELMLNKNKLVLDKENIKKDTFKLAISKKSSNRGPKSAAKVNVISKATGGGISKPSVGGDSSSSGSVNMGCKLIFDFDMVANASILEKLGYQNDEASSLLDAWEGTSKEMALLKSNPYRKVVWDRYLTFVQNNRVNNSTYKTFGDYFDNPEVVTTKNGYYQMKYALGNGIGKPIYTMDNIFTDDKKNSSALPDNVYEALDIVEMRKNIVIPMQKWTSNLNYIKVDGKSLEKGKDFVLDYSNSNLIIKGDVFDRVGNIRVEINANGFDKYQKDTLVKANDGKSSSDSTKVDEDIDNKDDYFRPEEADFDEAKMKSLFPGMTIDLEKEILVSDGRFNEYPKFIKNIEKVEINGKKISFGTTGVIVVGYGDDSVLRFFKQPQKGDTVSIYSRGFEVYKYFVK